MLDNRVKPEDFARRLRAALAANGWRPIDLRRACAKEGVELQAAKLSFWVRGLYAPQSIEAVSIISRILGVSPEWLCYGGQDDETAR